MSIMEIKTKLLQRIENSDERQLNVIYALLSDYDSTEDNFNETRMKLIFAERERYLAGIGKSYTWDEVKHLAIHRQNP